ncbi:MAG: ferritin-like domain-containing protein [Myxococcales bacterium]|nr:ferritin-like domain-containing protein [Myxococcales bacterium]MBL0192611.1 ferritin-like domain-containing protein [Myxococcales bacterium]
MSSDRLRSRVLLAVGLSALPTVACSRDATPAPGDTGPLATAPFTATPTPTPSGVATPTSPDAADLGGLIGRPPGGGCGFTVMCVPAPTGTPKHPAPAPYGHCEQDAPGLSTGSLPHRGGVFSSEQTALRSGTARKARQCCYQEPRAFCGGGRPLPGAEGPLLAPRTPRDDWHDAALSATRTPPPDAALAERFLVDAAFEHASIAAFGRASLQLVALGAPADLVRDTHAAAIDEVHHARLCLALARRRGAPAVGPGPLPLDTAPIDWSVTALVTETFHGGCVGETRAALELRERAERGDAVEREVLSRIAEDEERHAELAFRTVAWALDALGPEAHDALRDAVGQVHGARDEAVIAVALPCVYALLASTRSARATS